MLHHIRVTPWLVASNKTSGVPSESSGPLGGLQRAWRSHGSRMGWRYSRIQGMISFVFIVFSERERRGREWAAGYYEGG